MRVAAAHTDIHVEWRALDASVLKGSCFDRSCRSVSVAYKFIVISVSRRRRSMHVVRDVHEGVHSYATCAPPQPSTSEKSPAGCKCAAHEAVDVPASRPASVEVWACNFTKCYLQKLSMLDPWLGD